MDQEVEKIAALSSRVAVHQLIDKAVDAHDASDAMKFTQAACNAAQALLTLDDVKE